MPPDLGSGAPLQMAAALAKLARAQVVAVPTESVYALAVDATSSTALDTLFSIKPRDTSKGIGLVVPRGQDFRRWLLDPPAIAEAFMQHFWPGPLTLVVPAGAALDARLIVHGHVALRMPGPSLMLDLVEAWGSPLTATSANRTGQPPCRTAESVFEQFQTHVGASLLVLPGQPGGAEVSSLVRVSPHGWELLREGAITRAQLQAVAPM